MYLPIHTFVNVWQKPLQYCRVISLQLIKINGKKMYLPIKKIESEMPHELCDEIAKVYNLRLTYLQL